MKFFDMILTTAGPGYVIARTNGGRTGVVAAIRREDLVGMACRGPCVNLAFRLCQEHGVWFRDAERCPMCAESDDAGD